MAVPRRIYKGIKNPKKAVKYTIGAFENRISFGTNIFEYDWDILIILDACRSDLFEEFAPKHESYDYFDEISSIWSVASMTPIWLRRTFHNAPEDMVKSTHYVTGAGQSERCLNKEDFHQIDHVWKYAMSQDYGQTKSGAITDAAIDAIRNSEAERIVIHYPEPHAPFLHCLGKYNSKSTETGRTQNVWEGLKERKFDKSEVWEDYGKNLLTVLDEVLTIIRNSEDAIVITSDHGNAIGEWGVYGHPARVPIKSIRKVPWIETKGTGKHIYEIKGKEEMSTGVESSLEEHLQALGYY